MDFSSYEGMDFAARSAMAYTGRDILSLNLPSYMPQQVIEPMAPKTQGIEPDKKLLLLEDV